MKTFPSSIILVLHAWLHLVLTPGQSLDQRLRFEWWFDWGRLTGGGAANVVISGQLAPPPQSQSPCEGVSYYLCTKAHLGGCEWVCASSVCVCVAGISFLLSFLSSHLLSRSSFHYAFPSNFISSNKYTILINIDEWRMNICVCVCSRTNKTFLLLLYSWCLSVEE